MLYRLNMCYELSPLVGGGRRSLGDKEGSLPWQTPPSKALCQRPISDAGGQLAFAFDVVGDLVYLVKDVAIAVDEVGDLGVGVHDGGVIAAAEGATDLG